MLQILLLYAPPLLLLWSLSAKAAEPSYLGSQACGQCHTGQHRQWSQSLHSRMIQQAKPEVILGDFVKNNTLEHHGWNFRMTMKDGGYWIDETDKEGSRTAYKVDYTLGSKRTQHYLS